MLKLALQINQVIDQIRKKNSLVKEGGENLFFLVRDYGTDFYPKFNFVTSFFYMDGEEKSLYLTVINFKKESFHNVKWIVYKL